MDFPTREATASKGDNGKVLVIGGSPTMHGAPILAALGALAADVDLVRLALPAQHAEVARNTHLNLIVEEFSRERFSHGDAEALAASANEWADAVVIVRPMVDIVAGRENVLLTPHSGEFVRLTDMKPTHENVAKMAKHYRFSILKKGAEDIIAGPEGEHSNTTGCPQMAVGGTGDALAGICGGLLARGLAPADAARLAAEKWGEAGEQVSQERRVLSAQLLLERFARNR